MIPEAHPASFIAPRLHRVRGMRGWRAFPMWWEKGLMMGATIPEEDRFQ